MYKAVAQSVLLYSSESLVVTGAMLKVLEGLHHQLARQVTGMIETSGAGREWEYPLEVAALEDAGLHPIIEYIRRQQATIVERVVFHPIYELYVEAERRTWTSRRMRWWDQDMVNEHE